MYHCTSIICVTVSVLSTPTRLTTIYTSTLLVVHSTRVVLLFRSLSSTRYFPVRR